MTVLQRKIPRKTPLASKALKLLLSDDFVALNPTPEPGSLHGQLPKHRRAYVPPTAETIQFSSILSPPAFPKPPPYNHEFSAKLRANVAANILASPVRMDKLSRMLLPSRLMIKLGLSRSYTPDGRQKIWLSPIPATNSHGPFAGSKGYILCKKASLEALATKNKWLSIIPSLVATSSKIAQSAFLVPLNVTMNRLKKARKGKKVDGQPSEEPSVLFDFDTEICESFTDTVAHQIGNLITSRILKHHTIRLGLEIPTNEYYFVLTWRSESFLRSEGDPRSDFSDNFCTQVISIPEVLSATHSDQIYALLKDNYKKLEKDQYIKIPSKLGMPLQVLLWKYQFYQT